MVMSRVANRKLEIGGWRFFLVQNKNINSEIVVTWSAAVEILGCVSIRDMRGCVARNLFVMNQICFIYLFSLSTSGNKSAQSLQRIFANL